MVDSEVGLNYLVRQQPNNGMHRPGPYISKQGAIERSMKYRK